MFHNKTRFYRKVKLLLITSFRNLPVRSVFTALYSIHSTNLSMSLAQKIMVEAYKLENYGNLNLSNQKSHNSGSQFLKYKRLNGDYFLIWAELDNSSLIFSIDCKQEVLTVLVITILLSCFLIRIRYYKKCVSRITETIFRSYKYFSMSL